VYSEHGDIGRALIERGVAMAEVIRRNDPRLKDLASLIYCLFVLYILIIVGYGVSKCTSIGKT